LDACGKPLVFEDASIVQFVSLSLTKALRHAAEVAAARYQAVVSPHATNLNEPQKLEKTALTGKVSKLLFRFSAAARLDERLG
jgi:hypothetical protein